MNRRNNSSNNNDSKDDKNNNNNNNNIDKTATAATIITRIIKRSMTAKHTQNKKMKNMKIEFSLPSGDQIQTKRSSFDSPQYSNKNKKK